MSCDLRLVFLAGMLAGSAQSPAASVEVIPAEMRGGSQPQVAATANGEVYIAFGRNGAVHSVTSKDGGQTFARPVVIDSLPKLALGMRRGPRIAASDRFVVITAISHAHGNLFSWSSNDQGATWSPAARINSTTNSAREGMHAMTSDAKGTVYAAWLDLRNGKTELWGAASHDGGRSWSGNQVIYRSPDGTICECCHPSLAVDGQGHLWAMWRNWLGGSRDMYASVSKDGGKTFSAARKLGSGTWPLKGCPMDGGQMAFGNEDRLLTVWRREKALFTADDRGETLLTSQGLHPVVGVGGGTTFHLWQNGSRLMIKKGSAQPQVFAENGAFPAIASGSRVMPPIVVWESMTNGLKTILAQRLE
jgi:hypothetical protein